MEKFIIILFIVSIAFLYYKFIIPIHKTINNKEDIIINNEVKISLSAMKEKDLVKIVIEHQKKKKGLLALERIKKIDYSLYDKINNKYSII